MLDKVLEDTQCHTDLAVSWCINAKNYLHSIHGFFPFQLAIGKYPKLPSTLNKKAPALTRQPASKIVSSNLDARHKAREAFIASENSKKIRRALSHNIIHLVTSNTSQETLPTISAWTVQNGMDQPKYLAKTANNCLSQTEEALAPSTH